MKEKNLKNVAVILGFFNGNKHIFEQINSIISQTHKNIKIFIFDDNSTDKIIMDNINKNNNLNLPISVNYRNTNLGYAKNFLLGLRDVGSEYDYYAFSDQDDLWESEKVEFALKEIDKVTSNIPILYCSRTAYYTKDCSQEIGSSRDFKRKPIFQNSLIQNIAGGNTIILNNKARELIVSSLISDKFISHDWWCYQLISAAGGKIIFHSYKSVKYRQHISNLIGGNQSFKQRLLRFRNFFSGSFKEWTNLNIKNLIINKKLLTTKNRIVLESFIKSRESKNFLKRIFFYIKSGVYRQTLSENIIFIIGILLNKI